MSGDAGEVKSRGGHPMGQTEWSTLGDSICAERGLSVVLSWDMPQGYETANGTFDPVA